MMFKKLAIFLMVPLFSLSMVFNQSAYAEWYVGGAIGVAIPHDVDDLAVSGGGFTVGVSSFSPDTSFTGGIKGGYFLYSFTHRFNGNSRT